MKTKRRENWQYGFLSFFSLFSLRYFLVEKDPLYLVWLLWLSWLVYFFPAKKK